MVIKIQQLYHKTIYSFVRLFVSIVHFIGSHVKSRCVKPYIVSTWSEEEIGWDLTSPLLQD